MSTNFEQLESQERDRCPQPRRHRQLSALWWLSGILVAPVFAVASAAAQQPRARGGEESDHLIRDVRHSADAALSTPQTRRSEGRDQGRARDRGAVEEPRLSPGMAPLTRARVSSAFRFAVRLLEQQPACADLFDRLGSDGVKRLGMTLYRPVNSGQQAVCRNRRALAFTHLRSPVTMICPVFNSLPQANAALALIHEALHFAGLPESPSSPEALTSSEIQRVVEGRCRPVRSATGTLAGATPASLMDERAWRPASAPASATRSSF